MSSQPILIRLCGIAAIAAGAALVPGSVAAQPLPSHAGLGLVANAPHQFFGVSGHLLPRGVGGFGLYVDAKRGIDSPRDRRGFTDAITVAQAETEFGDQLFRTDAYSRSANAALVRAMGRELLLYAGAGVVRQDFYHEYLDRDAERGVSGFYTVKDGDGRETAASVLAGAFFRLGTRVWVQLGAESRPRGFTIGGHYTMPFR